jgi:hypothetical protein
MKTIIIPDLHNRVDFVELALLSPILQPYDNVIFLGDYFDDFHDTNQDIKDSATWLKQSLHKPNRIHLWGTHDLWYRFPNNQFVMVSGNTKKKCKIINNVMTEKDWNLLRSYHYEQDFLMTHAGIHKSLIDQYSLKNKQIFDKYLTTAKKEQLKYSSRPKKTAPALCITAPALLRGHCQRGHCQSVTVPKPSTDIVNNTLQLSTHEIIKMIIKPSTEDALKDVSNNISNNWFEAGFARGGFYKIGGIIWLDWRREFEPVPGLNQIVGHTEMEFPEQKINYNSKNYCLDTRSNHIGILENGEFTYVETIDVLEAIQ